ncbi:MAG: 3-deoxy-manno-octulosonate cytidylyltransferase [Chlamydiae bacterium]|nr:MAG: 3-deoxy-manno-octulosonate cytidylyltransferase [Chlamydiota bacterium]
MQTAIGIIPARMASTRFPGKPLKMLTGYPVIQHVYCAAEACAALSDVWVATDDNKIAETVKSFGGKVVMTKPDHTSGTDRIVEAVEKIAGDNKIIVNIQGDEPLVRPDDIDKCVAKITSEKNADWATLIYKLNANDDRNDPNTVKVVCDSKGFALYFSRAQIPYDRDKKSSIKRFGHIGLYVYKINALKHFASLKSTPLELIEKLEQLRALESGMKIICVETEKAFPGIDTPEDLANVNDIICKNPELISIKL